MKQSTSSLETWVGELRQTVDTRLTECEARMDMADLRVSKIESFSEKPAGSPAVDRLAEQMQELERQIAALKVGAGQRGVGEESSRTTVIGGPQNLATQERSETWLLDKLRSLWAPALAEIFSKGDFKGQIFAKFPTQVDRDEALKAIRKASLKEGAHEVWAKEDLPVETRASRGILFGLKYLLKSWEIHGAKVDEETTQLTIGAETAQSASPVLS